MLIRFLFNEKENVNRPGYNIKVSFVTRLDSACAFMLTIPPYTTMWKVCSFHEKNVPFAFLFTSFILLPVYNIIVNIVSPVIYPTSLYGSIQYLFRLYQEFFCTACYSPWLCEWVWDEYIRIKTWSTAISWYFDSICE